MGYYEDDRRIRHFMPDDTANVLHLASDYTEYSFDEIEQRIKAHFGEDAELTQFTIEADYIHTSCIGYDLYDPGDYTKYLIIRKK